jgi:hypothetical protein
MRVPPRRSRRSAIYLTEYNVARAHDRRPGKHMPVGEKIHRVSPALRLAPDMSFYMPPLREGVEPHCE